MGGDCARFLSSFGAALEAKLHLGELSDCTKYEDTAPRSCARCPFVVSPCDKSAQQQHFFSSSHSRVSNQSFVQVSDLLVSVALKHI